MQRALIVVAALILGVFVWLAVRTIDLQLTWQALRDGNAVWVVPSLALLALSVPMRALRWWAVFSPGRRPTLGATTSALLVGLFFNTVLPFRAGEAARLLSLARRAGISRAETLATIAVERVFDVLALVVILLVSLPFLPEVTWLRAAIWLALVLGVGLALAIGVLLAFGDRALSVLLWPLRWLPFLTVERLEWASRNLGSGLAALRSAEVAVAGAVLTILSWLVLGASAWALMPAFDLDLGFEAGLLVIVAVGLAMIVPSPPAALGVFEGAVVVALVSFDVDASIALSYALVFHAVNVIPYLAAGPFVLPSEWASVRAGRLPARREKARVADRVEHGPDEHEPARQPAPGLDRGDGEDRGQEEQVAGLDRIAAGLREPDELDDEADPRHRDDA